MESDRVGASVLGSEKSVAVADAFSGTTAGGHPPLLLVGRIVFERWAIFAALRPVYRPRRADARRSCASVASSSNGGRFSPHCVRFTDRGGLTPAALVRASHRLRMVGDFRRTAFGLPTTAG